MSGRSLRANKHGAERTDGPQQRQGRRQQERLRDGRLQLRYLVGVTFKNHRSGHCGHILRRWHYPGQHPFDYRPDGFQRRSLLRVLFAGRRPNRTGEGRNAARFVDNFRQVRTQD